MPEAAVTIEQVSKKFGAVQSLSQLDLTVGAGSVFGFLGPNGAGKTTTLRILLGLVRPDSGTVSVLGLDPVRQGQRVRASVGALLDNDGLYDRLTASDNLDYHGAIHRIPGPARRSRIQTLLRTFELWDRRDDRVADWSKGMRQKLAIARALMHQPKLLFLDEPFSGLDPVAASSLRSTIVELAREHQATVLLTTHDLAHVEKACDRVAVIGNGHLVAEGAPGSVGGDESELEVEVAGGGLDPSVLERLQGEGAILRFTVDEGRTRVWCAPAARAGLGPALVRHGVELEELHTVRRSLEDAFLALVGR